MTGNRDQPGGGAQQRSAPALTTATCTICQAVYSPSEQRQDLLLASKLALESALLSMSHFCFRCRRPACPACWDTVHAICASCVQEVGLPFRTPIAPLDGALLAPVRKAQGVRSQQIPSPLTLVRPGRFSDPQESSIESLPTRPEMPASPPPVAPQRTTVSAKRRAELAELKTRPPRRPEAHTAKPLERFLTWFLFVLLVGIVILISASLLSEEVNRVVLALLHIDIRTEVAYLLQLLKQLFS